MLNPVRSDKSPMLTPTLSYKADRSPRLMPVPSFVGEELANNVLPINVDLTKLSMCFSSQLMVDVERIPKRLLPKLKERPELASIEWSSETGMCIFFSFWSSANGLLVIIIVDMTNPANVTFFYLFI